MGILKYTRGGEKCLCTDSCFFKRKSIFQVPVVVKDSKLKIGRKSLTMMSQIFVVATE